MAAPGAAHLNEGAVVRHDVVIAPQPAAARGAGGWSPASGEPTRKGQLWIYEDGQQLPVISGGAVTALWYGKAFEAAFNKEMDLDTDVLKCMLCTSTYAPNQDTHKYKSDITNEVVGTGYTATGAALTGVTATGSQYTGATNVWAFDAGDTSWPTSTITARFAVVYDSTPGTDATRPLLFYVDFGADVTSTGGTFLITWAAGGLAKVTVS